MRRAIEAIVLIVFVGIWAAVSYAIAEGFEVRHSQMPYVVEARTLVLSQETPFQMESRQNSSATVLQPDGATVVFMGVYQVNNENSVGEWLVKDGVVTIASENPDFIMRVKQHRPMIILEICLSFILMIALYLLIMWRTGSTW